MTQPPEDSLADAMADAIRFLALRMRTSGELRAYLRRRGYAASTIEQVLARCRERKFIDDRAFAEQFVRRRLAQGYGPRRLARELANKGLAQDVYRPLLDDLGERDLFQVARQLAVKKASGLRQELPLAAKKAKIARHLQYKGFPETVIHRVLDALFSSSMPHI